MGKINGNCWWNKLPLWPVLILVMLSKWLFLKNSMDRFWPFLDILPPCDTHNKWLPIKNRTNVKKGFSQICWEFWSTRKASHIYWNFLSTCKALKWNVNKRSFFCRCIIVPKILYAYDALCSLKIQFSLIFTISQFCSSLLVSHICLKHPICPRSLQLDLSIWSAYTRLGFLPTVYTEFFYWLLMHTVNFFG